LEAAAMVGQEHAPALLVVRIPLPMHQAEALHGIEGADRGRLHRADPLRQLTLAEAVLLPERTQEIPGTKRQPELADALLQDPPEQAMDLPHPGRQVLWRDALLEGGDPFLVRDGLARRRHWSPHSLLPPLTFGSKNTTSEPQSCQPVTVAPAKKASYLNEFGEGGLARAEAGCRAPLAAGWRDVRSDLAPLRRPAARTGRPLAGWTRHHRQ